MENTNQGPKFDSQKDDFTLDSLGIDSSMNNVPQTLEEPLNEAADFSLKMFKSEKSPDQESDELSSEESEALEQKVAKQSKEHRRLAESALVEPRNLAKALTEMKVDPEDGIDPEMLQSYIRAKKEVFGIEDPKEIADELMKIEKNLVEPLISKLNENNINLEQKIQTIESVREAFYGMILNKKLTSESLLGILNGEIFVKDQPGEEVEAKYRNIDIYSYIDFDKNTNKFNIYIYKNFFKEKSADKSFLLRHEFAHAAAYSIWGKRYTDFLEASKNPHSSAESFRDAPELREVLRILSEPSHAKPFFRKYIRDILEESETELDANKVQELRMHAAQEIVADMCAHYLEGASSTSSMIDFRARYLGLNKEELLQTILETEGVTKKQLMEDYDISSNSSPEEIVEALSQSDNLAGLFRLSSVWRKELDGRFKNSGKNINYQSISSTSSISQSVPIEKYPNTPEFSGGDLLDLEDPKDMHSERESYSSQSSSASTAIDLWNFFAKGA